LMVLQSFLRHGFPGGTAPSSGSRVHSAVQILKQRALVSRAVDAFSEPHGRVAFVALTPLCGDPIPCCQAGHRAEEFERGKRTR
jgi:hypothetical protein